MKLSGLILACLLIPITIAAQSLEYVNSGLWFSRPYSITIDSSFIYCAGDAFTILSKNGERPLQLVGGYRDNPSYHSVAVRGNYAYCSTSEGLEIIDCSEPWNCRLAGSYDTNLNNHIAINGDYAYLVSSDEIRLTVLNIGNPIQPEAVGYYHQGGTWCMGMNYYNNHIIIADSILGLYVIDVTNPEQPLFTGSTETEFQATGITVKDNLAYILSFGIDSIGYFDALEIFDISNIQNPSRLGTMLDRNESIFRRIEIIGNYAYIASINKLTMIDIVNPSYPVWVNSIPFQHGLWNIMGDGEKLYTSNVDQRDGNVSEYNISDHANPVLTNIYNTQSLLRDVTTIGNHAFVCDDENVYSIDITNPDHPVLKSMCLERRNHWNIYSHGSLLITSLPGAGLNIYDAQNPDSIASLSRLRMPGAFDLYANGNYVYMTSSSGLSVVDISNPAEPESVTVIPTPDVAFKICGEGIRLFVSTQNQNKLIEYDLSNPALPEMVTTYELAPVITSMKIDNLHLFTLDHMGLFTAYDISVPGTFSGLDTIFLEWAGSNLTIRDNLAFFNYQGIQVYDISDPSNLTFISSFSGDHISAIEDIELPYIYCTNMYEMWILRFTADGVIEPVIPDSPIALSANYPNPFNSSTSISYTIPAGEHSTLTIYDICGRSVRAIPIKGNGNIVWNGRDDSDKPVSSGVYFYAIAGQPEIARKMLLVK